MAAFLNMLKEPKKAARPPDWTYGVLWCPGFLPDGELEIWPDFADIKHDNTQEFYRSYSFFISQCPRTSEFCSVWQQCADEYLDERMYTFGVFVFDSGYSDHVCLNEKLTKYLYLIKHIQQQLVRSISQFKGFFFSFTPPVVIIWRTLSSIITDISHWNQQQHWDTRNMYRFSLFSPLTPHWNSTENYKLNPVWKLFTNSQFKRTLSFDKTSLFQKQSTVHRDVLLRRNRFSKIAIHLSKTSKRK